MKLFEDIFNNIVVPIYKTVWVALLIVLLFTLHCLHLLFGHASIWCLLMITLYGYLLYEHPETQSYVKQLLTWLGVKYQELRAKFK